MPFNPTYGPAVIHRQLRYCPPFRSISAVRVIVRLSLSASVPRGAHGPPQLRALRGQQSAPARRSPFPSLEAPSSKTLAMQKQTGKSGGSGGGTPAKRGRPFGSTTGGGAMTAAAAAAVGDPGAPALLVGPSLQVLAALSGNLLVSLLLQFHRNYVGLYSGNSSVGDVNWLLLGPRVRNFLE